MIPRRDQLSAVKELLRTNRVVALLGARQVGKTTLARMLVGRRKVPFFDLEDPRDLRRLADPMLALEGLGGLVVIDEVQKRPDLFPALRVLADRPGGPRFLLLGSASPGLLRQSSESLAGRIAYHELDGFSLDEVGGGALETLWLRGGFPRAFTARAEATSFRWRRDFVRTFVERDVPGLGVGVAPAALSRLWSMLAHCHGQTLNLSELGRSLGVSDMTVRHHVELLAQAFVLRVLPPWHENLSKRQVKAPKVYVRDTGLLHALLDIRHAGDLARHPKVGASWEGFCVTEVLRHLRAERDEAFFWATHAGAELDLMVVRGSRRRGFEVKHTDTPSVTPSMRKALEDLRLESIDVIHRGADTFPLAPKIRAVAARRLTADLMP